MFVVTRVRIVASQCIPTTHVWRIFSAAKGSSLFHNTALSQIVEYYRQRMELKCVHVFTDGCRSQYKGKRNFCRIAKFAADHSAEVGNRASSDAALPVPQHDIKIMHHFACGHHFKGPHDGYGKDAKHLARTAERHQRARLATTYDLYHFDATNMPCPRRNILAAQIVAGLPYANPQQLCRLPPERLPTDWQSVLVQTHALPTVDEGSSSMATSALHQGSAGEVGDGATRDVEGDFTFAGTAQNPEGDSLATGPDTAGSMGCTEENESDEGDGEDDLPEDDVNARAGNSEDAAGLDTDEEYGGAGDFDFEFDVDGSRIEREEQLNDTGEQTATADNMLGVNSTTGNSSSTAPQWTGQRRSRVVRIVSKPVGQEGSDGGEERIVTQQQRTPGYFTAHAYFWLYYAVYPATGMTIIPVDQVAQPNECHAILDAAEDVDADSVEGSNATYAFAGVDPSQPNLLLKKTFSCYCPANRTNGALSTEHRCPHWAFTGIGYKPHSKQRH